MAGRALDRFVVGILERTVIQLWGFAPPLMAFVVADMGPLRAMGWFVAHMPRYQSTLYLLGPVRTHLACMVISLRNGCRYCAFGQAYALELIYLRDRGMLFPIDAHTLAGWFVLSPDELRLRLRTVLQDADMHAEVLWVERTLDLAEGTLRPVDAHEGRISHLVRMIGVLNSVGIGHHLTPDQAHDPINKDTAIRARYAELRAT